MYSRTNNNQVFVIVIIPDLLHLTDPHFQNEIGWAAMAAWWVELLTTENEPIEPGGPAGDLPLETKWQRHQDHLKSFEQLKSSSGHPSTHSFLLFFQVRDYIRVQQREWTKKKKTPSGGFSERHKDTRRATFNILPPGDSCHEKNVKPLRSKVEWELDLGGAFQDFGTFSCRESTRVVTVQPCTQALFYPWTTPWNSQELFGAALSQMGGWNRVSHAYVLDIQTPGAVLATRLRHH